MFSNCGFHNPVRAWVVQLHSCMIVGGSKHKWKCVWFYVTASGVSVQLFPLFQLPTASKNHRGLDSDWLVSLNTFSQNPLILKLELFRSKSVSDMDFPIISENWVCRFLANYLLDIMQCKLEMAWGFFSNAHIRLSLFIKTFSAETCPHIRKVEYPHIYVQNTLQLPSKISIFLPKALFLAPKMIF